MLMMPQLKDLGCALTMLPVTGLSLKLLGLRGTERWMRLDPSRHAPDPDVTRARQMAKMVTLAARYGPYRATCLKRALALRWMLARAGIASELKLGVRRGAAAPIEAHAWVECEGEVLLDDADVAKRFAPLDRSAGAP